MALADYYARSALAAAQALRGGFEESRFKELLDATPVGVSIGASATSTIEGEALSDLTVRLLARLYPSLAIVGDDDGMVSRLRDLAKRINPEIELDRAATVGICIGSPSTKFTDSIYVGSDGWDALVSVSEAQSVGSSHRPYGAGAAACFAAGNLFRRIFLPDWPATADSGLVFSTFDLKATATAVTPKITSSADTAVLVGAGAVGNAAIWALGRSTLEGVLHIVDPQVVELSNLQRYVLAERLDEDAVKVEIAQRVLEDASIDVRPHQLDWATFVDQFGYDWPKVLVALDSARDRVAVQSSLPQWVANSWTQPGDLGVSIHPDFLGDGACVSCLYLQDAKRKNEDELIAEALRVPDLVPQVRQFLHTGEGLNPPFLDLVAQRLGQPSAVLAAFAGRHVRELYVEGICGGAVLPLGQAGAPDSSLHVPLAHQSALAGVLLAASYERSLSDQPVALTETIRVDLLRPIGQVEAMPARKRGDGRCICEDDDFRIAYERKWPKAAPTTKRRPSTARPATQ